MLYIYFMLYNESDSSIDKNLLALIINWKELNNPLMT